MPRAPRPTDRVGLKKWVQSNWPKEPARQKSEFDAGMAAIGQAQKDRVAQAAYEDMKRRNLAAARRKR